jgi:hypothetical protein
MGLIGAGWLVAAGPVELQAAAGAANVFDYVNRFRNSIRQHSTIGHPGRVRMSQCYSDRVQACR